MLNAEELVLVRWRRDDEPDGVIAWGELRKQRPELASDAVLAILSAGFTYEHADGTTVELAPEERGVNREYHQRVARSRREWIDAACSLLDPSWNGGPDDLRREIQELKRRIETKPPWTPERRPLTNEEMVALRSRWAFGPERYQSDADAMLITVLDAREQVKKLLVENQDLTLRLAELNDAKLAMKPDYPDLSLVHAIHRMRLDRDRG